MLPIIPDTLDKGDSVRMGLKRGVILYQSEKVSPKHEAVTSSFFGTYAIPGLLALVLTAATAARYFPDETQELESSTPSSLVALSLSDLEERFSQSPSSSAQNLTQNEPPKISQNAIVTRPVVLESKSAIIEPSRFVKAYEAPKIPKHAPSVIELSIKVGEIIQKHGKKGVNIEELSKRIVVESISQQYDPLFVAAVIKSESAFNKFATSGVGAKGLMQIMPATGKFIAELKGFESVMRGKLTDPGYNVKLGITYLKHLDELFDGNRVFTLTAYNWGPGRMEDAFNGKRKIPKDVMNYALKILGDHEKWKNELEVVSINASAFMSTLRIPSRARDL